MRIQRVSRTKGLQKFSTITLDCLSQSENNDGLCMLGGVSRDGTFGWMARGSFLEVFSISNGQRLSAWSFGAAIKEPSTTITAVCECVHDYGSLLVVATCTVNPEGLICLFDPKSFRIVKAIEVPYAVKSLEVVSCYGQRHTNSILLSDQLKHFCGVLAVGTHCGHVYLVDLCLDDDVDGCDELSPSSLQHISHNIKDVIGYRYSAISRSRHLYVELGEEYHVRGYYNYCRCDGTNLKSFTADDICVSCLKFVERTGLLVVGFSFGAFQLWYLRGPILEYSSRYEDSLAPVNSIAYQEPEDDPRNYCYLWVARGPQPSDSVEDYTSGITLYQLGYEKKTWYHGFGYLFENLKDVGPRFEHDLTSDPFNLTHGARGGGSRVISCFTVNDSQCQPPPKSTNDDSFDGGSGPDLGLCVFAWEAASVDPHSKPPCFLGLFDMNRWYHAHMPQTLRLYGGSCDVCPYFSMYSLDGVQQEIGLDNIMAVHMSQKNISRFLSVLIPEPEQHFYPSSLTFEVTFVTETGVIQASCLGIQRQILADLQKHGPHALIEPHDLYMLCLHACLLPRSIEAAGSSVPCMYKRDALLTMAMNHNLIGFLSRCATALANGEFKCDKWTLKSLLEWAWKRVASVKEHVDRLCVPLYDWSGVPLDKQTRHLLRQHSTSLRNLSFLLNNITLQSVPITEQGQLELETKQKVVTLITEHVDVVLWMCSVNLLPECSEEQVAVDGCFVYPVKALLDFYEKRRSELYRLHRNLKTSEVLMIDSLIEHIAEPLRNLWEREGGTEHYPPPSVHAVVNMFLLDGISLLNKQIIVFYLLCDLVNSAPEEMQALFHEKIMQFTQKFNIPLGLTKLVHGMWLLDHKDFEDSMHYLLHPSVKKQILAWQHRCILKALLYQGQSKMALQYLRVRSPPSSSPEDVKLKLTVLLSNGLTAEAFEFQRLSRDKNNVNDLLSHLFVGCQETKTVDQLLLLPFSGDEEHYLVEHLKSIPDLRSQELLVLYYLLRSRYVEAVRLNSRTKQRFVNELDPVIRERSRVRNSLVDSYYKLLPSVQRKLCLDPGQPAAQRIQTRREFTRPTPLSTMVNKLNRKVLTRSALLKTVLNKVYELKTESTQDAEDENIDAVNTEDEQEPGPFICTPIISRTGSKIRTIPEVEFPRITETMKTTSDLSRVIPAQSPQTSYSSLTSQLLSTPPQQEQSRRYSEKSSVRQHLSKTEAILLLDTPVVKHKRLCQNLIQNTTVGTPHSILKVRHQPAFEDKTKTPMPVFRVDELSSPVVTMQQPERKVTLGSAHEKTSVEEENPDEVPVSMQTPVDVTSATDSRTLRFANVSLNVTADDGKENTVAVLPQLESRHSLHERDRTSVEITAKHSEIRRVLDQSDMTTSLARSRINDLTNDQSDEGQNQQKYITPFSKEAVQNFSAGSQFSTVTYGLDESDNEPVVTPSSLCETESDAASHEKESFADTGSLAGSSHHDAHLYMDVSDASDIQDDVEEERMNNIDHGSDVAEQVVDTEPVEKSHLDITESMSSKAVSPSSSQVAGDSRLDISHEKLIRKDVFEENESEQVVKEVKTPLKLTKVVKETSITKRTSIKVIDVDQSEADVLTTSATGQEALIGVRRSSTLPLVETADETANKDVKDCTDLNVTAPLGIAGDVEQQNKVITDTPTALGRGVRTRHSVGESSSAKAKQNTPLKAASLRQETKKSQKTTPIITPRKGRKSLKADTGNEDVDKLVLTPTRRSSRLAKSEQAELMTQQVSRTPKRQTRSVSHSSSPAKSNTSSPGGSIDSLPVTPSRKGRLTQKKKLPPSAVIDRNKSEPSGGISEKKTERSAASKLSTTKVRSRTSVRRTPSRTSSRASSPALSDAGTEESFIMTLRSGHKFPSRDTTPDSVRTDSTLTTDTGTPQYRFSVPIALSEIIEENSGSNTPVPDFIFSPPVTRSRQKGTPKSQAGTSKSVKAATASPAKKSKLTKSRSKKVNKDKVHDTGATESPINFIPEISDEELDSASSVASSTNLNFGVEKVRSLRPRRRARKLEPLKW